MIALRERLILMLAALIAFGLAVGPQLGALPGPFRFFYNYVPGFDSIRAVARLAVPGLLVVALLAAAGLDWVRAHLRFQPMVVGVVACLLVALELSVSVPRVDATRSAAANADHSAGTADYGSSNDLHTSAPSECTE